MTKPRVQPNIIRRMDDFAKGLLDEVDNLSREESKANHNLAQRLNVFKEVAIWIKVKHGIVEPEAATNEGSMIRELKQTVAKANADKRESRTGPAAKPGRKLVDQANDLAAELKRKPHPVERAARPADVSADTPAGLAALKSSLPSNGAGHPVGYSHDAVGAVPPADDRYRELHSGLLSDSERDPDDPDGGGEL